MKGIPENAFINIKNRSFVVTADIEVPQVGAEGRGIAQGGDMGGGLYVRTAHPGLPGTISVARFTRSPAPLAFRPVG